MKVKLTHFVAAGLVVTLAAAISACGSQANSPNPVFPTTAPATFPTAVPVATFAPFTSTSVSSAPSVAASLPLPTLPDGYSGSIGLSFPTSYIPGTTITTTVSNVAPVGVATLSSVARQSLAVRKIASANGAIVVLTYDDLRFNNPITFEGAPSFVLTVPPTQIFASAAYYVALFDPTRPSLGWQLGFEGPAKVSGSTLTFSSALTPFTFAANADYYFATYVISASAVAPTPAPSISPVAPATATPNPNASPTVAPTGTPCPAATAGCSQPTTAPTPASQPTPGSQPT